MREIKQSDTAKVKYIYMVLSIDHITPATGKTVTVNLSKNGAAFGAASGAVSEVGNGVYSVAGNATDNGTLGPLALYATATGCDPFYDEFTVVAYDPYDSVRIGLTALPNANAEAAGGLYTRGSGAGQINQPANGVIDANAKTINGVSTSSVTTVNANVGTTQPVNFTGTGASALAKSDMVDIAGTASAGTAGYVAPDWGHINAPTTAVDLSGTTIKNVDNAIANVTTVGTTTNLTNAPTSGDFTATMKTSLNASTPASVTTVTGNVNGNVTGSVGSVLGNVAGSVASVVGNVGGNVVGSVGSVVASVSATISDLSASVLSLFFTRNTTKTYADAVDGSIVKEIAANAGGGGSGDTSSFSGTAATEINAITAKVNLLSSSSAVTVTSPVSASQNIYLITHTDYLNSDGRALSFVLYNCPDITGGSVSLNISISGNAPSSYSGVVDSSSAFHVDLTRTQTGAMNPGPITHNVVITLANGDVIVPITGNGQITAIIQ